MRLLALLFALVILLSACGGGSDTSADKRNESQPSPANSGDQSLEPEENSGNPSQLKFNEGSFNQGYFS